jgi:hypothetical protein
MPPKLARSVDVHTDEIAKHPGVKSQELKVLLSEYWFALRLGVWLCLLPISLRLRSLPELLKHFTQVRTQPKSRSPLQIDRAVGIVVRICLLRLFRLRIFPKTCLRQSLALYHVLHRMGYPVEIHFGIHKDGEDLRGHSWITIQGKPVADTARREIFNPIYSYRSGSQCSPQDEASKF